MRRHQQNISFVTIIGILMSIAFFFSQQNNQNIPGEENVDTSLPQVEALEDLPDCSADLGEQTVAECYANAVTLSDHLVEAKVDAILALETDTGKRMAFVETQSSWEEARNADCYFVEDLTEDADLGILAKNICLRDHNLERISLLETMICEYYDPSACESPEKP